MTDRIANPWGGRTPFGRDGEWPVRVDQFLEEGVSESEVDRWVQTASILHSNGDARRGVFLMAGGGEGGLHGRLVGRFGARGEAIHVFSAGLLALGVGGSAAYLLKQPLLFPSLGPTAYLFFEQTGAPTASPRNALIGHAVAILSGAFCLLAFGLLDNGSTLQEGVAPARIGAAALSLALTGAVLLLLDAQHPPSGATVLIVSLGFLQTPTEMAALMAGILLLTVVCWAINRASGVRAPVWSAKG